MLRASRVAGAPLFLVAGLLLAGVVSAEPRHGPGGSHFGAHLGPGGDLERHVERLEVDEETRAAIRAIVEESRAEAAELRDEQRAERRALHELLEQDTPDEAAVMERAGSLGEIGSELRKHRLRTLLRIRALLTPEQRAELMAIHRERRARHEERHGRHQAISEACSADREALCGDAEPPFLQMKCLHANRERVSGACAEALEAGADSCRGCPDCPGRRPQPLDP